MSRIFKDRIVDWAPYGRLIEIYCKKCGATGYTKNIYYIGARTLFIGCSCDSENYEPLVPPNKDLLVQEQVQEAKKQKFINEYVQSKAPLAETYRKLKEEGHRNPFSETRRLRDKYRKEALEELKKLDM